MSNKKTESVEERLERMKREKEAAKASAPSEIINNLTNEAETDFSEIAKKLEERKAAEAKGENEGYQKMTIYVRDDIARSFNALITKRGQQKEFVNQALSDFIKKKAKELGMA